MDASPWGEAVERLEKAAATGNPCAPVRDLIGPDDVDTAYMVQSAIIDRRVADGATRIGRKIGLTSAAVQAQFGVDQPDFGVLLDDMAVADRATIPPRRLLQPKVEGEIAFVLGADLAADSDGEITSDMVRAAIASVHAAIEIVDSRIADWDITIADTIADNASSGLFVISPEGLALSEVEPKELTLSLSVNGTEASTGIGTACLGDPLIAVQWLARTAAAYGDPLRAGDVVLSGALGPIVPAERGDVVVSELSTLGRVSLTFAG